MAVAKHLAHLTVCPISRQHIHNPVMATDGIIYEEVMIKKYFRSKGAIRKIKSPMTGVMISRKLIISAHIKDMFHKYYHENGIKLQPLTTRIIEIDNLFDEGFVLSESDYDDVVDLLINNSASEKIMDDVFSNHMLVNYLTDHYKKNEKFAVENLMVMHGKKNDITNIKILVDKCEKNLDINAKDYFLGVTPIHILISSLGIRKFNDPKILLSAIECMLTVKGIDLEKKINDVTPIHEIFSDNGLDKDEDKITAVKMFIEAGADFGVADEDGYKVIHKICSLDCKIKSKIKMIKYLKEKGDNINEETSDGETVAELLFSKIKGKESKILNMLLS